MLLTDADQSTAETWRARLDHAVGVHGNDLIALLQERMFAALPIPKHHRFG
jgi:hypothetical protein